jgi:hypothetical protein
VKLCLGEITVRHDFAEREIRWSPTLQVVDTEFVEGAPTVLLLCFEGLIFGQRDAFSSVYHLDNVPGYQQLSATRREEAGTEKLVIGSIGLRPGIGSPSSSIVRREGLMRCNTRGRKIRMYYADYK